MTATKDNIITLPQPELRHRSKKITEVTAEVHQIVADMKAATLDWERSRQHEVGVALAAVQINQLYRIVIIRDNPDDKKDEGFTVFINPEITKTEGPVEIDYEGCLSITDIYGKVPRYKKVRVKAMDLDGKVFRVTAEGFLARVLQHEIDHTNGKVFIDHIKNKRQAFYKLTDSGELEKLDYDKEIKANHGLWD
ncbi:MAG: peptide deformylase [Candidatus Saccharimonadales bacterium]